MDDTGPRPDEVSPAVVGLAIVGDAHTNWAIHTHGGESAVITRAAFAVENQGPVAVHLVVTGVDVLRGHCMGDSWDQKQPVELAGSGVALTLDVAAGATEPLRVDFRGVKVYQACDRFGFRLHLRVGDRAVVTEAPLDVTREEPLD